MHLTYHHMTPNSAKHELVIQLARFKMHVVTLLLFMWLVSVQSRPAGYTNSVTTAVSLTPNITLEGNICPVGIKFSCSVQNLSSLTWYFGDQSITKFFPEEQHRYPYNLCQQEGNHSILREICDYHGKLLIMSVKVSEDNSDLYSMFSTLEVQAYFVNNGKRAKYASISCGSNEHKDTVTTDFTVSCNNDSVDPLVTLSSMPNITDPCPSEVELTCTGSDLLSFYWSYNLTHNLSDPYLYNITTDHFPMKLHSSLPGVEITVIRASKRNYYSDYFNLVSTLTFTNSNQADSLKYITCGSPEIRDRIDFSCYTNILQNDKFCNFNTTLPFLEMLGNVHLHCYLVVVPAALVILIFCCCCCCCCCCYWYKRRKTDLQNTRSSDPERQNLVIEASDACHDDSVAENKAEKCGSIELSRHNDHINPPIHTTTGTADTTTTTPFDARTEERIQQEHSERGKAWGLLSKFVGPGEYRKRCQMKDLGSRLQKYYYKRSSNVLLTIAPVPKNCSLVLDTDLPIISERILPFIQKHKCIHAFSGIYATESNQVIVAQHLAKKGSLKDQLYKDKFKHDWSEKYLGKRQVLSFDKIARYGGQILSAVLFLYEQGFPSLGHIHTGNIFMTDDGCALGGYDNTLLGYRSSVHRFFRESLTVELLESIDVIMFGRVIFEMASQRDLLELIPDEDDLRTVEDLKVRNVLEYIFQVNEKGRLEASLDKIIKHQFFSINVDPSAKHLSDDPEIAKIFSSLKFEDKEPEAKSEEYVQRRVESIVEKVATVEKIAKDDVVDLPNIGWRAHKHWKRLPNNRIMSLAKVSKTCPVYLISSVVTTLNEFVNATKYDIFQPCEIRFHSSYVVITQPLRKTSLRDVIYKTAALSDKSAKMKAHGCLLTNDEVFSFSRQILQAVLALYEAGFPPLGHIQTGNIFVDGDKCLLGGYENTLLGYQPRFQLPEQHNMDSIDVFMFGHVVYEMTTGRELLGVLPSDEDYKAVLSRKVKAFLKDIFKAKSMNEIYGRLDHPPPIPDIEVSEEMKLILKKVCKAKARKNTTLRRFKAKVITGAKTAKERVEKSLQTRFKPDE